MEQIAHTLNACSQLLNAMLFCGHSNESISGRCYRENRIKTMKVIDSIFFWQPHHCKGAYTNDLKWAREYIAKEV